MTGGGRGWLAEIGGLAGALALAALLCLGLFAGERAVAFTPERPPPADGLYAVERFHSREGSFRWTAPAARLDLPNPGGPLRISLELSSGGGRDIEARLGGAAELALPLGPEPRRYELRLPPQPGERLALDLIAPVFRPAGETRDLGVELGQLEVAGGRAPAGALLVALLMATAVLYGGLRSVAAPLVAGLAAPLLPAALLLWHTMARWEAGAFAPLAAVGALGGLTALLGWRLAGLARGRARAAAAPLLGRAQWPAAALLLALFLGLGLWNQRNVHPGLASDLGIYLGAGRAALAGENPYLTFGLPELVIGESFIYTPATLPLFAALAALGDGAAEGVWLVGSLALYLCALLSIYAALPAPPRGALPGLLLLGLGFAPFLETLAIGQINSLMLLGLALFLHGHAERRLAWLGDAALAAAILVKLTPAILLLWPLARRDWPRLVRVGLAAAVLCLPALLLFGPQPWLQFAALLPELLRGAPRNPYNQALVGLLTALTPENSSAEAIAGWAGRATTPLLLGSWALVCWRGAVAGPALAYGVVVLTVASSLIWHHHLAFLALPLAWLAFDGGAGRRGPALALAAVGLIQADRLIELGLGAPPWPAVAGYLLVLAGLASRVLGPAGDRAEI